MPRSAALLPLRLLVVSLLVGLAGCSKTLRLEEPAGAVQIGFDGGERRALAIVTPFADGRVPPTCSKGKLGSDGELGDYASFHKQLGCSSLPPEWVARRLVKGLEAAEFVVLGSSAERDVAPDARSRVATVRGRLDLLEIEGMARMQSVLTEADLQAELFVTTPSGLSASRRFHVKAQQVGMTSGGDRSQETLNQLIDRAVREMTAGVVSLLNRYPDPAR